MWDAILAELADLCVAEEGMELYDQHLGQNREVHVILAGIFADSPARKKTNQAGGANAHFPCSWCLMQAKPNARTLYAGGYLKPATIDRFEPMYELH